MGFSGFIHLLNGLIKLLILGFTWVHWIFYPDLITKACGDQVSHAATRARPTRGRSCAKPRDAPASWSAAGSFHRARSTRCSCAAGGCSWSNRAVSSHRTRKRKRTGGWCGDDVGSAVAVTVAVISSRGLAVVSRGDASINSSSRRSCCRSVGGGGGATSRN